MPITATQLEPGDILFKHASKGAISQRIRKGQMSHYNNTIRSTGPSPVGRDAAVDITHVAMASGPDEVLEFDEGGASKWDIVMGRGYGFVRGAMSLASRRGKRYEVFRCTDRSLATVALDKAELIWDMTHQGNMTASYGLSSMLQTAVFHRHGAANMGQTQYERELDSWLRDGSRSGISRMLSLKPNLKFFCSEFVAFCYLWAASETKEGRTMGAEYLFGTDKSRIAPVELYTRVETAGRNHFQFKGTLYTTP
jgi:hypothetical protein